MSALFNFHSFLRVVFLGICTCTYLKMQFPALLEQRTGFRGFFWKAARIGGPSFPTLYRKEQVKISLYISPWPENCHAYFVNQVNVSALGLRSDASLWVYRYFLTDRLISALYQEDQPGKKDSMEGLSKLPSV